MHGRLRLFDETPGNVPLDHDDALNAAVGQAQALGLAGPTHKMERFIDGGLQLGLAGLGFVLSGPVGAGVAGGLGLAFWAVSPGKMISRQEKRISEMAKAGPGIIDPTLQSETPGPGNQGRMPTQRRRTSRMPAPRGWALTKGLATVHLARSDTVKKERGLLVGCGLGVPWTASDRAFEPGDHQPIVVRTQGEGLPQILEDATKGCHHVGVEAVPVGFRPAARRSYGEEKASVADNLPERSPQERSGLPVHQRQPEGAGMLLEQADHVLDPRSAQERILHRAGKGVYGPGTRGHELVDDLGRGDRPEPIGLNRFLESPDPLEPGLVVAMERRGLP